MKDWEMELDDLANESRKALLEYIVGGLTESERDGVLETLSQEAIHIVKSLLQAKDKQHQAQREAWVVEIKNIPVMTEAQTSGVPATNINAREYRDHLLEILESEEV